MRILHVSTTDRAGGAEKLAFELFQSARADNHETVLAVGQRRTNEAGVIEIPNDESRQPWPKFWRGQQQRFHHQGTPAFSRLAGWFANLGEPTRWLDWRRGYEDFHYPGIAPLFERLPFQPDIVHLHNLHGGYFDLRALTWMSQRYPVVLTLHDEWILTGHCAYTFDCQRWQTGCGSCPNLATYPALKRDGTSYNLKRKERIYAESRLYVSASSHWLIDRARRSILRPAMIESRVVPYGIDLDTFNPASREAARSRLNLPADALVVLFIANRAVSNEYKDYRTLEAAMSIVAGTPQPRPLYFIAVGEDAPELRIGSVVLRRYGYQQRPAEIALFYQAADLYAHAARAEAFGLVIAEAMACQLPVVATAVGGVPELIDDQVTGYLVPPGDSESMARKILALLANEEQRLAMGEQGRQKATHRYDRARHFADYRDWYREILASRATV
ncbi:MAG: glycosyltransferase [Acidobacteriota bacterium]